MNKVLLLCSVMLIHFNINAQQQIKLIDKMPIIVNGCEFSRHYFKCDTNIVLEYYGDHSKTISDENINCLSTVLKVYNSSISLDSIYHIHTKNKIVKYMPGIISGTYYKQGMYIYIILTCFNQLINNSTASYHKYVIKYNVNKRSTIFAKYLLLPDER
jgi:hypothetical protein